MRKNKKGWSIVLAGFWNRMIFTPDWVGPRLFGKNSEIETVVALLPILPITYRDNQIAVEISSARIVCRARILGDEFALRKSGDVARTILKSLPETPVQGVGVNFGYCEDAPAAELLDLFGLADDARWGEAGWEMGERRIVRQLTRDSDTLNLALTLNDGRLDVDCNFHTAPNENAGAIAAVEPDRLIQLRDLVTQSLDQFYGLEVEEDDDEA